MKRFIYLAWVIVALYMVAELVDVDKYMDADGRRLTVSTVVGDAREASK